MGKIGLVPKSFEDLTNKKFGRLTVLKKSNNKTSNSTKWVCICDCGTIIETDRINLVNGRSKSCGCLKRELTSLKFKKTNIYTHSGNITTGLASNCNKQFIIDREDFEKVKDYCWFVSKQGYLQSRDAKKKKIIYLHSLILNFPTNYADHINRDKLDNRKSNLREATQQQNNINKSTQKNNTSGVIGVYFDKHKNKWVASLNFNNKKYMKRFTNIEDAVNKRKELEDKYFKEYKVGYYEE